MSAKLGFAAGLAVGLLAGSRAGRGLYDKSAAAASAVVRDPRVRSGASTALHKAGSAGSSVAGAAARKVKNRGTSDGDGDGAEGSEGERAAALRRRTKRLMGGVRKHGVRVNGHGVQVNGHDVRISRPNLHLHGHGHANGANGAGANGRHAAFNGGMSAPYVQPKPTKSEE
ncbi:MAG TPA: hypothetical protein VL551_33530 [Actinospica sp.]|nr:hypothetical protein [Actinospica sp.]